MSLFYDSYFFKVLFINTYTFANKNKLVCIVMQEQEISVQQRLSCKVLQKNETFVISFRPHIIHVVYIQCYFSVILN